MTGAVRRRRLLAGVVVLALLLGAAVLVVRACGGDEPPTARAVRLVPDTTLVYVHASTDTDRPAVGRASRLLARFDTYASQRDSVLRRLAGSDRPVDVERDIEPWLGDEAVLALTDAGTATAGSLVIFAVRDQGRARRFIERNPRRTGRREYKGQEIEEFGTVNVAFADDFLIIGQGPSVQAALDRARGQGRSLDEVDTFRRATRELPEARVLDAYASADGLRRLLVPQGGVVGGLATLLDQPALQGVGLSAEAVDGGAKLTTRSILDRRSTPGEKPLEAFEPQLLDDVPADALAYFGVKGISDALGRVLGAATGAGGNVGPLLQGLRRQLDREAGGRLERDLLRLLREEVAIVISRATPAPVLSLVARTGDERGTRETLRRVQAPLARLLSPRGEQPLRWREEDFGGGVRGATLPTPVGASISYAVFDGRLVLATSPDGVRRIRQADDALGDAKTFEDVLGDRPGEVGSLGFLDFSQLLELGEQTGLNDSRAYLAARDDLQEIRAVGVHSTGSEGETTAEILLSIP